jgi:hypothetical protein
MKKSKIVAWVGIIVMIMMIFSTFFMKPDFEMSSDDIFLFRLANVLVYGMVLFGFVYLLDPLQIKEKFPVLKKIWAEVLFWGLDICIAGACLVIVYNNMSDQYKADYEAYSNGTLSAENSTVATETEQPKTTVDGSWATLAKDKDEYIKVLKYVGNNFRFNKFKEEKASDLSEDELILVKDLFSTYFGFFVTLPTKLYRARVINRKWYVQLKIDMLQCD